MKIYAFLAVLSVSMVECAVVSTVIDLTYPLSNSTIYWPGTPSFSRNGIAAGGNNLWIEVGVFTSGEHGGTHIDAPRHFSVTGYDLKDLPIELTIAEGVMIDIKVEATNNSDYSLTTQKIEEWETTNGRIPSHAAVLINTGWTSRWPNHRQFFNTETPDDPSTFHFPTVSQEAAQWLVINRQIKMLGVDVASPDNTRKPNFPVHTLLLSRNITILENVMIPDTLPARNFRLHFSPIRVEGGTGTPTRVYAMLNIGARSGYSFSLVALSLCALLYLFIL